jgi:hypothetical protein
MVNSRQKGKRGELEARDAVRAALPYPDAIRSAQRDGRFGADLAFTGGLHCEVKRLASIAVLKHMEQAERDEAIVGEDKLPIVVMRADGDKEWVVMLRLTQVTRLIKVLNEDKAKNDEVLRVQREAGGQQHDPK